MRIAHTLLIKNEVDIVRAQLDYHLSRGLDPIIVTDNGSTDGTLEILREYAAKENIFLIQEAGNDMDQSAWVTRMARMAYHEYGADWVIHSDADEFWWPVDKDFPTILAEVDKKVDVLVVRRYNFVPRPEEEGTIFDRMIYKDLDSRNALGLPLPPKVVHRGRSDVVLEHGNHEVRCPPGLKSMKTEHIEVFHFPMRSYAQYERKIVQGAEALARNEGLPKLVGITWRKMYEHYRNGTLKIEWDKHLFDAVNYQSEGGAHRWKKDTRLRNWIKGQHHKRNVFSKWVARIGRMLGSRY